MKQTYTALLRHRVRKIKMFFRVFFYKFQGMQLYSGVSLGKIDCSWPRNIVIGQDSLLEDNVSFKINTPFIDTNGVTIGKKVFIGQGCEFNCSKKIVIGDNCLIASKTTFVDNGHTSDINFKINEQPCTSAGIDISNDVWIGTQCIILQGVTIGEGSIIGAGSLVNRSIPPFQIWVGSPAKFLKNR